MKKEILLALVFLALLLVACDALPEASLAESAKNVQPIQPSLVELDVFSGRENPTWTLSEDQSLALGDLLAGLEQTEQTAVRFEGLGYRGFLVQWVVPESDAVFTLYAGRGLVEVDRSGEQTIYLDPLRDVEKWLLESGKAFLEPELYQSLVEEIH